MESCNGEIRLEIKTTQENCGEGSYRNESSVQRNLNETLSQESETVGRESWPWGWS